MEENVRRDVKVLFLTNYPSPYRVDFFNELGKSVELTVLCTDEIEQQTHRDKKWFNTNYSNFLLHTLKSSKSIKGERICLEVISWIKKPFDYIILGGYSSPTAMLAIVYMNLRHIPFVYEADGGIVKNESFIKRRIKHYFLSSPAHYFSSGKTTTDYFLHYGAKADQIWEYPFTSLYKKDILEKIPTREEKIVMRTNLGIAEDRVILGVGQFVYGKGFDILMKAAKELPQSIGIYIVGGEPTEEYTELKSQLELKNIHFVGFQPKESLRNYYMAADLFVLPTRGDVWGLVVSEAMANALPVITTDQCVAGLEMVVENANGAIVPVDDIERLKTAIETILPQVLKNDRFQKKALEVAQKYTIENMVNEHLRRLVKKC